MNGDPASERVQADMKRWDVRLDFAGCEPVCHTPIIVQEIRRGHDGTPTHRFVWSCPECGRRLPKFKPITRSAVDVVEQALSGAAVFFMDRLSRATLLLAARASAEGTVVVFEPSGKGDPKLFAEALRIAHLVKYSEQQLAAIEGVMQDDTADTAVLVEVQTLGRYGLKFRHRFGRKVSKWCVLDAVPAPFLADICGSGDWCTAGLLAEIAAKGRAGLHQAGPDKVRAALRYGQALAAWNCGYEGARGGMYAMDHATFLQQIEALTAGRANFAKRSPNDELSNTVVTCPACPPVRPQGEPDTSGTGYRRLDESRIECDKNSRNSQSTKVWYPTVKQSKPRPYSGNHSCIQNLARVPRVGLREIGAARLSI